MGDGKFPVGALRICGLIAVAVLLEGFDTQLIALCLPAMAHDWNLPRGAFAGVLALGTLGIAAGSAMAGVANDRFGRRPCLIAAVALVGVSSLAAAGSRGLVSFGAARLAVGIGIGAAFVGATTSLAEVAPPSRRNAMVSLGVLCMPIGALISGLTCAGLLAHAGWRPIFLIGGATSLAFSAVLALALPETPAFLARHPARAAELRETLTRLGQPDDLPKMQEKPTDAPRARLADLLAPGMRSDTLLIWAGVFACLLASYLQISWIPALFSAAGASLSVSSAALAANSTGAILSSVLCVLMVQRLGTRWPLMIAGAAGTVLFVALGLTFGHARASVGLFVLVGACAFAVALMQSLLYVLLAQAYPSSLRGAGVGLGMGVGRLGAVSSAFGGAWMLPLGPERFFIIDAAILLVATVAIAGVRRHARGGAHGR